jgi:hypothetical protein
MPQLLLSYRRYQAGRRSMLRRRIDLLPLRSMMKADFLVMLRFLDQAGPGTRARAMADCMDYETQSFSTSSMHGEALQVLPTYCHPLPLGHHTIVKALAIHTAKCLSSIPFVVNCSMSLFQCYVHVQISHACRLTAELPAAQLADL